MHKNAGIKSLSNGISKHKDGLSHLIKPDTWPDCSEHLWNVLPKLNRVIVHVCVCGLSGYYLGATDFFFSVSSDMSDRETKNPIPIWPCFQLS